MRSIISTPATIFEIGKAVSLAKKLNQNLDDDWTYKVQKHHGHISRARIKVCDEAGEIVGYL